MNSRILTIAAAALFGALLPSSSFAANLVTDGNFDNPYAGSTFTTYFFSAGDTFGPWTVTSGSVDLIGAYWQNPTNMTQSTYGSVDLDGTSPGSISQTFNLNPGKYVLDFSLSGNPDGPATVNSLQASIAGQTGAFSFTTGSNTEANMGYVGEQLAFSVSGVGPQSVDLSFLSTDAAGGYGPVIGKVAVSAVPLPASLSLFLTALIGLGAFSFYRRRQAV